RRERSTAATNWIAAALLQPSTEGSSACRTGAGKVDCHFCACRWDRSTLRRVTEDEEPVLCDRPANRLPGRGRVTAGKERPRVLRRNGAQSPSRPVRSHLGCGRHGWAPQGRTWNLPQDLLTTCSGWSTSAARMM